MRSVERGAQRHFRCDHMYAMTVNHQNMKIDLSSEPLRNGFAMTAPSPAIRRDNNGHGNDRWIAELFVDECFAQETFHSRHALVSPFREDLDEKPRLLSVTGNDVPISPGDEIEMMVFQPTLQLTLDSIFTHGKEYCPLYHKPWKFITAEKPTIQSPSPGYSGYTLCHRLNLLGEPNQ